jgi:hypothetical protein
MDRYGGSRSVDRAALPAATERTRKLFLLAPLVAVLALVPVAVRFHDPMDFGLAFQAGQQAWSSGHPERIATWSGTPFYAMVMGLIARAWPLEAAAVGMLVVNLLVRGGLMLWVWNRLRGQVPTPWWWGTLAAAAVLAPGIATIFWMQPNVILLALALGGVVLVGRHDRSAGMLIGLMLAIKPVLVLLPFALLLRRETRRAALWSIVAAALLTAIGLGFLAWRAGDLSVGSPIVYAARFMTVVGRPGSVCVIQNYSPTALLCRFGVPSSTALTILINVVVLGVAGLLAYQLRDARDVRWEVFAAASLLSPMLGPIGWAAYQVLLAPLMLLLAYQFWVERAPAFLWANLGFVFLLTMLIWDPLESRFNVPVILLIVTYTVGQFAQYFLILLWVQWLRVRSVKAMRLATAGRPAQAG